MFFIFVEKRDKFRTEIHEHIIKQFKIKSKINAFDSHSDDGSFPVSYIFLIRESLDDKM